MAAFRSASFCLICFLICSSEALEIKKAHLGQDVILPCKVPNINNIIAVEWIRPDQDPGYVLFYRDGHFDPDNQHPSYQNRVDLQDKEMKDGDVSLILKNVKMEDRGIYVCRVLEEEKYELISFTFLEVHPPGDQVGVIVASVVGVILLLLALLGSVGFWLYKRLMKKNPNVSPDEAAAGQMLAVPKSPAEPATASETLMNAAAEEQTEM